MTQRKASLSTGALDALLADIRSDLWSTTDNHRSPHPDPTNYLSMQHTALLLLSANKCRST